MICVFAGSFDPVTLGHVDIVKRGAAMTDKLYVVVMENVRKKCMFSVGQRLGMLEKALSGIENVVVESHEGLLTDYVADKKADFVIRGVRNAMDFEYERDMAVVNSQLGNVETFLLITKPEYSGISSGLVRELLQFGGDPRGFVPDEIIEDLYGMNRGN